jgi:hypothetical protein
MQKQQKKNLNCSAIMKECTYLYIFAVHVQKLYVFKIGSAFRTHQKSVVK